MAHDLEKYQHRERRKNQDQLRFLIQDVGLEGFEHYLPHQLPGGMKKRCSIARAFYYGGEILLMDEPFTSLDLPPFFVVKFAGKSI